MIEFDVDQLIPAEFRERFAPAVFERVAFDVAEAARAKWISLSMQRLKTSQQEYTAAISEVKRGPGVAYVELTTNFANMIEQGFNEYDLRDTLLQPGARGVKEGTTGNRYRAIPFRLGGENTTGRNAQRITDLYAAELGKEIGREIGRVAMQHLKQSSRPLAAGYGPRLQAGQLNPSGRRIRHSHKTDLLAGAKKMGAPGHEHYGTFRTISTAQPDGWMHPGYSGAHLAEEVDEYIRRTTPMMLEQLFANWGK